MIPSRPVERVGQRTDRGGLGQRDRGLVAVVDLAAVLAAAESVLEFADRGLQGGIEAVGAGFAPDDRAAAARGDFDMLTVLALAPVALVVQLDVEEVDGAVETFQARQFV